jgi:hypothetical protein
MKSNSTSGWPEFLLTKMFPITISTMSLLLSTFNLYINYLRAPDINFVVAPYVSHVMDDANGKEAFFIPVTAFNQGARPGTILLFELTVTHVQAQRQASYSAQYYAKKDDNTSLGSFFSPMSLDGYSTVAETVCFYPIGAHTGRLFSEPGAYKFDVQAVTANVKNASQKSIPRTFNVTLTEEMIAVMQCRADGEYPWPMEIETSSQ